MRFHFRSAVRSFGLRAFRRLVHRLHHRECFLAEHFLCIYNMCVRLGGLNVEPDDDISGVNATVQVLVFSPQTLSVFFTEKMMSLICGRLWSSRILAYGIGMSTPVTLVTGESR